MRVVFLSWGDRFLNAEGSLDTGASVNVLPHPLGLQLGLIWEDETLSVRLAGNLARFEARAVIVEDRVASFPRKKDVAIARHHDQFPTKLPSFISTFS